MKWLPSLTKRDKSPDEPDRCVRAEPQFVKQAASCYPVAIPYLSPFMRGSTPVISGGMQIRVAYTTEENFYFNIVRSQISALDVH